MNDLYNLKEKICEELREYGRRNAWDVGDLEVIDKLAHCLKNLNKVIENEESDNGYSGYGGYNRRYSSARNRYSRGYSMANSGMVTELRELMNDAPNDKIRDDFQRLIDSIMNA